jgi:hypothetical protein|tara:strand:+ start:42 stop:308 length:267 start_codon:yes stop_codon:yes gene_type:complete
MTYTLVGYNGTEEHMILKTNNLRDATIEWLSFERDLKENPDHAEDRFDYIELSKDGVVLESQHKIEECSYCGHHDLLDCTSNGCINEN